MSAHLDGGSAFPVMPPQDENWIGSASGYPFPESGMSLRDWFAGQALAVIGAQHPAQATLATARVTGIGFNDVIARGAYEIADAMLAARSSKQEEPR